MKNLLLAVISMLISLGNSMAQEVILKLNSDGSSAQVRNYLFHEVIDSRVAQAIGQIYDSERNKYNVSYKDKLADQALQFYNSKISSRNISYELLVKIHNLDVKEIYQADRKAYRGEIQLSLGFFLRGPNDPVHLVDFNSGLNYSRPTQEMYRVEASIQRLFENSWEYFDAWLSTQYKSNRALVKKVRLQIADPIRPSVKDTVFYDPARPLTWEDFTESPSPISSFNATIFSSLSIAGNASIVDGEIVQHIEVKVYMLPGQSWVKDANAYANNHEQRHFDLTRIAADRMIHRLENLDLKPYLYEAKLNEVYLDAYREMNRLQEFYDGQTRHGLDKEAQARWNQMITEALSGNWEGLEELLEKEN
ncbi:hypothetical protein [Algoriphagus resistens]|uniref:hypothetical protein n=1 Tax=Algoriphagus resistens TaxID=1750590 RepID=UPI000716A7B5|nr:hypothetical protein [Algoriphagus resistens]